MAEVQHQGLNATFKGTRAQVEGVDQFLGIKYASIPARFEKAKPVQNWEGAIVDATKYGYDMTSFNPLKPLHSSMVGCDLTLF